MSVIKVDYGTIGGGAEALQEYLDISVHSLMTYTSGGGYSQFAMYDVSNYSQVKLIVGTPNPAYYSPYYKLDSGSWISTGGYEQEVTIDVSNATTLFLGVNNGANTYFMNIPIKEFDAT